MFKLNLKFSVLVVFALAIMSLFAYGKGWFEDFSLNLGTELIGVLISVLFIDLVVSRHERAEKLKLRKIALRQLRIPMQRHLNLLFGIYKASVAQEPEQKFDKPESLFCEDYFTQIAYFDFSKEAPVVPKQQWMQYIQKEVKNFNDSLSRTLEKYAIYLDSEVIDLLEKMINSSFLSFLQQIPNIRHTDEIEGYIRKYVFFGAPGMRDMVEEYSKDFSRITEIYNSVVDSNQVVKFSEDIWRNNVAPKIGSARNLGT